MKQYKLVWTQEAVDQLVEIERFIGQDSPRRAMQFVEKLIDHSEILSENPHMGRVPPEVTNPAIRELIYKNYRIVYRLKGRSVEILTVFESHKLFRLEDIDN